MREFNFFHADASADPRLHGIAHGLGQLFAVEEAADMPDELADLLARLNRRDDWDGPDRDGEV